MKYKAHNIRVQCECVWIVNHMWLFSYYVPGELSESPVESERAGRQGGITSKVSRGSGSSVSPYIVNAGSNSFAG